jgi:hypothetical protein
VQEEYSPLHLQFKFLDLLISKRMLPSLLPARLVSDETDYRDGLNEEEVRHFILINLSPELSHLKSRKKNLNYLFKPILKICTILP